MKLCNQIPKARAFLFQTKRFLKVFPIYVYIKQDGGHGGHLGLPTGTILGIFDLQVTPMLPTSLKSISLSIPEKQKIDFQDGRHGRNLGFPIRKILAIFDL